MKKNWWSRLQVKIIAWSFVPTVIILSAVAWFTYYSDQQVLVDLAIKQYPDIVQPKSSANWRDLGCVALAADLHGYEGRSHDTTPFTLVYVVGTCVLSVLLCWAALPCAAAAFGPRRSDMA